MAGQVSKRWRSVVEMVHDKAWRSLNKAVHLKPEFIGPKYKKIGWVENEHSWSVCKCINIARDLVFYDNIGLMDADLKQFDFNYNDDDNEYIIDHVVEARAYHVEEAEAFIRLAAAGILTSLDNLSLGDFDWTVVKNLSLLVKIVHTSIFLLLENNISGDLPKSVFNHINCESLLIDIDIDNPRNTGFRIFTDADIESLNEVLNRVKKLQFEVSNGYGSIYPIIEKYDGEGKCHMIDLIYNEMPKEEFGLEFEKVKEWATSRGWNVSEYEYFDAGEGFSRKAVHLRRKFEDLLDDMKQFEDFLGKVLKKK